MTDPSYWHQLWSTSEIGFHQKNFNRHLVHYFSKWMVGHVFVPLAGKSFDMIWLLNKGYEVSGVELSEVACAQFFEDQKLEVKISHKNGFKVFSADRLTLYAGDIFKFDFRWIEPLQYIYDRAALVALDEPTRISYVNKVYGSLPGTQALLIAWEYLQSAMTPPPFSIDLDWMKNHIAAYGTLDILEESSIEPHHRASGKFQKLPWLTERVLSLKT